MPLSVSNLTGFGSWNNITVITPSSINPTDTQSSPNQAIATLTLNSGGSASSTGEGSFNWVRPIFTGVGADYETRMTIDSAVPGGSTFAVGSAATGTWLALNTNRSWQLIRTTLGSTVLTCTLEIRRIGSTVNETTSTATFTATIE